MINSFTLLRLLKPSFSFVLNFQRLGRLMAVPAVIVFAAMLMESYYPLFFLAETAELKLAVNFYMLGFFFILILFLAISLMRRTQQIIFFGDDLKKIFVPSVNRSLLKYFVDICYIFINSLFLSVIVAYLLLFIMKLFMPLPDKANVYALLGAGLLMPYFMIRFCLILPASVAEKNIRFWEAWKMSRRISSITALNFALFLLTPFLFFMILCMFARNMLGDSMIVSFLMNFSAILSLMISSVLQAAYSAYLYSTIQNLD